MFGALRRLLMSGDIAGVLQSSRRAFQDLVMGSPVPNEASRARALEGLNERGGFSDRPVFSPNPPRGVTMDQGTRPAYTLPWESPRYYYETARGYPGVYDTAGPVRRSYYAGPTSSEIVAPYEGMRVLPEGGRYNADWGEYWGETPPGPWMGRGSGTEWSEMPLNGMDGRDGTYFEAWPGPRPAFGSPETWTDRPLYPWQRFAETGRPTPVRPGTPSIGNPIPFEDIMRAQGSLLGSPYYGPYIAY